jgi:flagellar M-ring protein FliF
LGTREDTEETYDPKTTATLTQEHAEENSSGGAPLGVPGTASNVPAATAPATGNASPAAATPAPGTGSEQSNSRSDSTTYAVSKSLHHSVEPAGRVRRIAAAVLVDDAVDIVEEAGKKTSTRRKRTADEMKQIEQLASAAIGVDAQRGDVLAVENLSFQEAPVETPPAAPGRAERVRVLLQPWIWTLRYIGLAALFLVLYWLVLRPVKKQALAAFRELPGRAAKGLAAPAPAATASGAHALGGADGSIEEGGHRAKQLKRVLSEKVKAEPETASRLVESWVRQEGNS